MPTPEEMERWLREMTKRPCSKPNCDCHGCRLARALLAMLNTGGVEFFLTCLVECDHAVCRFQRKQLAAAYRAAGGPEDV